MNEIRKSYDSFPEHQLEGVLVSTFFLGLPRRHPCGAIEGHAMVLYMVSWTSYASLALFLLTYLFFRSMYFVYQWPCHNNEFACFSQKPLSSCFE